MPLTLAALTVQLPFELMPGATTVTVTTAAGVSQPFPVTLESYAPVITGFSRASCLFIAPGDATEAYAIGIGPTEPFVPSGVLPQVATPTAARPIITIGGKQAEVIASTLVTWKLGVYQINFRVPFGLSEGIHPVVLSIGGKSSDERANGMLAVSDESVDKWTFTNLCYVAGSYLDCSVVRASRFL
jgi:uncharacterized protein (TIGR03437 family)